MSLCPAILKNYSTIFSICNLIGLNVPHITGPSQPMDPKLNTLRPNRNYQPLTHLGHNESNSLQTPF